MRAFVYPTRFTPGPGALQGLRCVKAVATFFWDRDRDFASPYPGRSTRPVFLEFAAENLLSEKHESWVQTVKI